MGNWIQDSFFYTAVNIYLEPDIRNLFFVTGCEKGKCASPLGLYVCKQMEFWGYLIAEEEYVLSGDVTEKIMSYLAMTLGDERAASLRPAIEFCSIPYALLGTGGHGITVADKYPLLEKKVLHTKTLALIFMESLDKLHELLGDEAIVARAARRLKVVAEG